MNIYIYKLASLLMILTFPMSSCNSWLDVKPIDRVLESQLFKTQDGFTSALNGIYLELNNPDLYGGEMLYSFIDELGQLYKFESHTGDIVDLVSNYNYEIASVKTRLNKIWGKYYALIANCNKILYNIEVNGDILQAKERDLILAETKALRAFLHFDVLRLWGPVYSQNPDAKCIPYNMVFQLSASELLSAKDVVVKVLADLKDAEVILKDIDPIIENGPRLEVSKEGSAEGRFRTQRMNYYAIKAMQARVLLYSGDKSSALTAAREVTAVQEKWFPFVEYKNLIGAAKDPDRVFTTELIFSLANGSRETIFDNAFSSKKVTNIYYPQDKLDDLFGPSKDKDWRYISQWQFVDKDKYKTCHKYAKIETQSLYYSNIIPLIRVSEMYYIVAECTTNKEEAIAAMNIVYVNRGLDFTDNIENINDAIKAEYVKEFYGEGQMFFYYKRCFEKSVLCLTSNTVVEMNEAKYILPLPEKESDYR